MPKAASSNICQARAAMPVDKNIGKVLSVFIRGH
jgi:hypothetical protein